MPAGEQIVSDGLLLAQSGTQRETPSLSLSPKLAPSRAILPSGSADKIQSETPGLSLSPQKALAAKLTAQFAVMPYGWLMRCHGI